MPSDIILHRSYWNVMAAMLQPRLWGALVFLGWTLTSYACHQSGKLFLASLGDMAPWMPPGLPALLLTTTQLSACLLAVSFPLERLSLPALSASVLSLSGLPVVALTHALATLATNLSMGSMQAASTFAVKMAEPVTSAFAQRLLLSLPLSPRAMCSLPPIVVGAVVFAGDPLSDTGVGLGVVQAMASNVVLAVRNVAVKRQHEQSHAFPLRPIRRLVALASGALAVVSLSLALERVKVLTSGVTFSLAMLLVSAAGHVAYSYISTAIVLHYLSVVSHAVCNILKRVLVVALLYSAGKRHALRWNWAGLAVAIFGLALYTSEKVAVHYRGKSASTKSKDHHPRDSMDIMRKPRFFTRAVAISMLMLLGWGIYHRADLGSSSSSSPIEMLTSWTSVSQAELVEREYRYFMARVQRKKAGFGELPPVPTPDLRQLDRELQESLGEDFFEVDLYRHPRLVNSLSPFLRTSRDVIHESQRIHFQVFGHLLKGFRYAMLFDMAAFENKGDPAITAGEVYLLRRLGIEMAYYCNFYACKDSSNLKFAAALAQRFDNQSLVILLHGGGSVVGYPENDFLRFQVLELFKNFSIVMFPQSIWIHPGNESDTHLEMCARHYSYRPNLTLVLRDRQSLRIARKYFKGTRKLMLPDMAFQIGAVPRFMAPIYDILWLQRSDKESPGYERPTPPPGVSMHVADWWKWLTPKGTTSMEDALLMATNGLVFLQRGRVVVTDRLHGHILSTLCDIPHVLVDNHAHKLSSYHNTWTRGLSNVVLVEDASSALQAALALLTSAHPPPVLPFMEAPELVSVERIRLANVSTRSPEVGVTTESLQAQKAREEAGSLRKEPTGLLPAEGSELSQARDDVERVQGTPAHPVLKNVVHDIPPGAKGSQPVPPHTASTNASSLIHLDRSSPRRPGRRPTRKPSAR